MQVRRQTPPLPGRRQGPVIERVSRAPAFAARRSVVGGLRRGALIVLLAGVLLAVFNRGQDLSLFAQLPGLDGLIDRFARIGAAQEPSGPKPAPPVPAVPRVPPVTSAPPALALPDLQPPAPPPVTPAPPAPSTAPVPSTPPAPPVAAPPSRATPSPASAGPSSLVQRPPGARPAVAPFADADVAQLVTRQIRRFNESRDVPEKQDAARQILAAALIGHPLARSVIIGAYRNSTVVQGVTLPADAIRIGLDFTRQAGTDGAGAGQFAALAGAIAGRDPATFALAVMAALRDDARLRAPDALRRLVDALASQPQACTALAAIAGHGTAQCDRGLATALKEQAEMQGPAGTEDAAYVAAERAFARYLQDSL